MKTIKYLTLIISIPAIMSCNKIDSTTPDFSVSVNKNDFNFGDTVRFTLSGAPTNIVFYSGEVGNNYDTRNKFTADGGKPEMTFTSTLAAASGSSTSSNLSLLVSNNFNGNYTKADISAATWIDITSSITIPGANQKVVLTPYTEQGKPLYVAFRFKTVNPALVQRLLTISNFSFKTVYDDQIFENAKYVYDAGFGAFDFAGEVGKWVIPITSNVNDSFTHPLVDANAPADEDWAISKPFETNRINPSTGVAIKNISNPLITNYNYVFSKAGTYKVVFVGSNSTNKDYKEVLKEFTITVK
ncbi:DUF5017 domain-containing protein [Pedobacter sp. SD-b]|uniref:DUF5017 domain-containing protein n=1 Tax=Pedobacter segetis TaxID=2793069 RepID=A0ABS1BGE4_9SPHI|nr:DUF5017 domain-containing protein [Pedobacter segetis]MBK0381937.1 DUF5017 domain-containing protein [Pedobacter segetis]